MITPATRLAFPEQPSSVTAGAAISPAVRVTVQDASGNRVTSSTANITLAITSGTGISGAVLGGTLTRAAFGGVATFTGLAIDKAGSGYTITATATDLTGATSAGFTVYPGAASRLAFAVQPSTAPAGEAISPAVQVTVQDAQGNTVTSSTASITIGIADGTGAGAAVLGGTLTRTAVSGRATFDDLTIDRPGSGFRLRATAAGMDAATSAAAVIAAPPVRDVALVDAQFTQAVQANDKSIPIVLGGNAAVVNVLLRASPAAAGPVHIVLRLFNGAGTLVRADTAVAQRVVGSGSYLTPDVQFLVPASVLAAGMRWQLARDPMGLAPDDSVANDVLPRQGTAALATVAVPPLRIRFVPVVLTSYDNVTGVVSTAMLPGYMQMAESIFPLGAVDVVIGAPFTSDDTLTLNDIFGEGTFWDDLLEQLDLARLVDPDPSTYLIGVVQQPTNYVTSTSGIAYIPASGRSSGAGTRTAIVSSNRFFSDAAHTRYVVAHELGHTFGRYHSPCGGAQGPDPSYPYSGGVIGVPGHDVRSRAVGRTPEAVAVAPTVGDIMGYCSPSWISDYTYQRIASFRDTTPSPAATLVAAPPRATRVLVVRGTVAEAGGVTLAPVFALDARAARPERLGRYHLLGRTAGGRLLFAYDFEPSTIDHTPGRGHFTFAIPVTEEMEAALSTIVVDGPAGTARMDAAPTVAVPADPAPRPVQRAAGGMVSVTCPSSAARAAILLDARTGAVLGTARGPTARAIASAGTPLTLVCSDGLRTTRAPAGPS